MRNAKVINVGVEKTANRRTGFARQKEQQENFGVESQGRFLRTRK